MISDKIISPPAEVDVTDLESLKAAMSLYQPRHFIFPFLAHAIGTLVGDFVTASIAVSHKIKLALGVGIFFLIGGGILSEKVLANR